MKMIRPSTIFTLTIFNQVQYFVVRENKVEIQVSLTDFSNSRFGIRVYHKKIFLLERLEELYPSVIRSNAIPHRMVRIEIPCYNNAFEPINIT